MKAKLVVVSMKYLHNKTRDQTLSYQSQESLWFGYRVSHVVKLIDDRYNYFSANWLMIGIFVIKFEHLNQKYKFMKMILKLKAKQPVNKLIAN